MLNSDNENWEIQDWDKIKDTIKQEDSQNDDVSLDELERMLNTTSDVTKNITEPIIPQTDELNKMFEDTYRIANNKARIIIKSLAAFYLDTDHLEEEYVKSKIKQDVLNFSSYMYSIEQNRDMMNEIMREIKTGNSTARMFEVYSTLQKANLSLIKDKKQYQQIMEAEYERFRDTVINSTNRIEGVDGKAIDIDYNEDEVNVFRGSKALLNNLFDDTDDIIPKEFLEYEVPYEEDDDKEIEDYDENGE
jgi:hypothetical protein